MSKRPLTIAFEGNIGSGKSTLMKAIAATLKHSVSIEVFLEPIEKWKNCDGHNLLSLFYKDPKRWAMNRANDKYNKCHNILVDG